MIFKFIFLCLCLGATLSSSIGSYSESLLTCSKFHFEEKVLEKLVRLEHKMEITEDKMKKWEESFFSKMDKMDKAINNAEVFVDSMRETQLQEQSRLDHSYKEIVKSFKIQFHNETELYGQQTSTSLESLSAKLQEFNEAENKREKALELMRHALYQDQKRLNQSLDLTLDETMKQTEIFVKSMRDIQLQEQLRLNDSYHENFKIFKIQSKNETEFRGKQMDIMLESLSSKIEEFSVAEKKRENAMTVMQYTLYQEQKRFNESFDLILEKTRVSSNRTIQELNKHKHKVLLTSCVGNTVTISTGSALKFSNVETNIGVKDLSSFLSSGKFTCEKPGLYQVFARITSKQGNRHLSVMKNDSRVSKIYIGEHPNVSAAWLTGIGLIILELEPGDVVWIKSGIGVEVIATPWSCMTLVKLK